MKDETTRPRMMLPRDENERRGESALARLIRVASGDSGQCMRVRRFLLGLYNGSTFHVDLTDLRALDRDIQDDVLCVLAMDMDGPRCEVHRRLQGDGEVIAEWAAAAWPKEPHE